MEPDGSDVPPLYLLLASGFGGLSGRVRLPLDPGGQVAVFMFGSTRAVG